MQHRDLFQEQIEQLGRVLGVLLAQLLGTATPKELEDVIKAAQTSLLQEHHLNIARLIQLENNQLEGYLDQAKFPLASYDSLAKFLGEIGIKLENTHPDKQHYLNKAVALLDLTDRKTKTVSFERLALKNRFKKDL